jgi:hypothetical protein
MLGSVLMYGCQKDFNPDTEGIITPVLSTTSVEGRITDETGLPVFGATVRAGLNSAQTDKNGMFKINNAPFTTSENFITVTKGGYFSGSRTFFARQNSNNFVRVQLLRKTISARIPASAGGDVDMRGNGGSINFEPNSFVTTSGANYTGTVLVATHYLNPTNADISDQMPGDLRGTATGGAVVGLKSFGMLAVELTDEAGQKLQIKSGNKATLTVNIPAALSSAAPATIPLWYFDDATGLWKQEGTATKTAGSYVGDVTHFTFWNCDDPYPYVTLKARVVNSAGLPVQSAKVQITASNGSSAYDYTDNNGYVDGFVPSNQTLSFQVLNACGQAVYSSNIGPYTTQTDLGNITITQNTTTIYGTATNCASTAVTDGYVQISLAGAIEFAGIINGSFSYTFVNCSGNTVAQLLAVDNGNLQQGNNVSVNLSSNNVNAGALTACGVSANTFFNLTINGTTISGNTSDFYRQGWKDTSYVQNNTCDYYYAAYDSSVSKYLFVALNLPVNQIFTVPSSFTNIIGLGYEGINGSSESVELSLTNPTQALSFTEYGNLGQFIAGNFTGQLIRDRYLQGTNTTDTVNAVLNFRVRHVSSPF